MEKNKRKEVLKGLIKKLHQGKALEEVKEEFKENFGHVSVHEISAIENELIKEGVKVEEIQSLCDVHASVFEGSIEEIHANGDPRNLPGHPANVFILENRVIETYADNLLKADTKEKTGQALDDLWQVDIHYARKENLFFPYMEKNGITAPPKVMWGVDDEIRDEIKDLKKNYLSLEDGQLKERLEALSKKVHDMVFKEEQILMPLLVDILEDEEWGQIHKDADEFGFLVETMPIWKASSEEEESNSQEGTIDVYPGYFYPDELVAVLNTLPFDITYVDKDDKVRYFSQSNERIFPRATSVIGRNVSNCHPPASVHIVEKIVEDFKDGKKDQESFWLKLGGKYVYIRYFAVRDKEGKYLGVVEVSQDIGPIQEIEGEKRLLD